MESNKDVYKRKRIVDSVIEDIQNGKLALEQRCLLLTS